MNFFFVLVVLIALSAGVAMGYLVHLDPGYVRISWLNWLVETNVWIALILFVLFYFAFHYLFRTLVAAFAVRAGYSNWRSTAHQKRSRRYTQRGLLAYAEGNWSRAQKQLTTGAAKSETPLVNYLAAAQAANALGNDKDREKLIEKAYKESPEGEIAIGLTKAQMLLSKGDNSEALATLIKLNEQNKQHPTVLKLLNTACRREKEWARLSELLPDMERSKAFSPSELTKIQEQAWSEWLCKTASEASEGSTQAINAIWDDYPAAARKNARVTAAYVNSLLKLGAPGHAAKILNKALKQHWDEDLVKFLGRMPSANEGDPLTQAEGWLESHPNSPALLKVLGVLAMEQNTWDKAREYLENSYQLEPAPETAAELGKLLALRGEQEIAIDYLQRALDATLKPDSYPANS